MIKKKSKAWTILMSPTPCGGE